MVLVTGGTGFIGKKLINCLVLSGFKCILLSRKPIEGLKTIICDLVEERIEQKDLKGIDTIFHLAGFTHDTNSIKNERLYQLLNVDATIHLADLAGKSGVKRFIFVSSVKACSSNLEESYLTESNQFKPEGVYGKTKREAELKILEIGLKYKMHVSVIRPSLVYGPEVKGNLRMMIEGIKKGWFPPLPETGNRRSMIHVDDVVSSLLLVANCKDANGEIYIATDGQAYSSREIYETICIVNRKSVPNWSIPVFFFSLIGLMSTNLSYKVNKLMGSEFYHSDKLKSIGFSASKTFRDMNESSF